MKQLFSILLVFFLTSCSLNNEKQVVTDAKKHFEAGNYNDALILLEKYSKDHDNVTSPAFWYLKGKCLQKKYNEEEQNNLQSPSRIAGIEAFAVFLNVADDSNQAQIDSARENIKTLNREIYNDAAIMLTPMKYELAVSTFELFKSISKKHGLDDDIKIVEVKFNLVLAQVYCQIYERDRTLNQSFFKKAEDTYKTIIATDSVNIAGNYNLAILYYNEAINKIRGLECNSQEKLAGEIDLSNPSQEIPDLKTLAECYISLDDEKKGIESLFLTALPYFENVYRMDSVNKNTLIGLSGIYFMLEDYKKSDTFSKKAERAKKQV